MALNIKTILILTSSLFISACASDQINLNSSAAAKRAELVQSIAYTNALSILKSQNISRGQYTGTCIDGTRVINRNYPHYEGLPVKQCEYKNNGLHAYAVSLNPNEEQIATWVANACLRLKTANQTKCSQTLLTEMQRSNSYQFNIAGTVVEGGPASGCLDGKFYYIQFRDGITVRLENRETLCLYIFRPIKVQKKDALDTNLRAYFYSRMSTLHMRQYEIAAKTELPKTTICPAHKKHCHPTLEWLVKSRESYITAWKTGNYSFLNYFAETLASKF